MTIVVSANNHPFRYDVEYSRADTGIRFLWIAGFRLHCFGATLFPQNIGDVFVAFTSASCRFLKEVHAGGQRYPQLEIIKLTTEGDTGIMTIRWEERNVSQLACSSG